MNVCFLRSMSFLLYGVKACSYLDQEVAPMETLGEAGSNDKVPQGPPGAPQGGPQKGPPREGEKRAIFGGFSTRIRLNWVLFNF